VKLLVTGGAGYIGSIVTGHLLQAGHDVTVLDNLSTGHRDAVSEGAAFVEADIADAAGVLTPDAGFEGIVHFAAKSLVGESMSEPQLYWDNNVIGTRTLLGAAIAAGVRRFVFSSTAAVYGEPEHVPIPETAPTRPTSAYGTSKLAVDLMLTDFARAYGLAPVSLRYFNVAGAWNGLGERHRTETHLIPIALQVATGERANLSIYGEDYPTPDGTCIRDYIHVADLAEAHLLALAAASEGVHKIFNLGSGTGFSVAEVLDVTRAVTGHPIAAEVGPRRAGDPAVLVASSDRIRAELGWTPARTTVPQMVGDAWDFVRARRG
jgi:UDP-glucose 4-epimerase